METLVTPGGQTQGTLEVKRSADIQADDVTSALKNLVQSAGSLPPGCVLMCVLGVVGEGGGDTLKPP